MQETKIVNGRGANSCHFAHSVTKIGRDLNPTNQSKAFTLAEVLITIVIIGVVAAISIPTVITNYRKNQYVTQYKKFYTGTANGLRSYMAGQGVTKLSDTNLWSQLANGTSTINTLTNTQATKDELSKIFKIANVYTAQQVMAMYPDLKMNEMTPFPFDVNYASGNIIMLADGSIIKSLSLRKNPSGLLVTTSGIREIKNLKELQEYERNNNLPKTNLYGVAGDIVVDVNGFKAPNIYGRDIFELHIGEDGMLYPTGGLDYSLISSTNGTGWANRYWRNDNDCSASGGTGRSCAGRIMEEGWKMTY